uniref:Uncharacterized protein n=1 Tax=Ciona savignyi TaxID=51511 RepID=H2ZB92_CIOSA
MLFPWLKESIHVKGAFVLISTKNSNCR